MKGKIHISAYLSQTGHGKSVAIDLKNKLQEKGYQVIEIENHKKNEWCRDYMPIVAPGNDLVQFSYAPGYMTDSKKWSKRLPDPQLIKKELNLDIRHQSEFILDGGAIEIFGKKAILSDRFLRENHLEPDKLIEQIQGLLDLDEIVVVPQYPYDFTGHVDGIVRFIKNDTVLINDMSEEMEKIHVERKSNPSRFKAVDGWYYSFLMTFHNAGFKTEVLPSNYANNESDKHGNGIYLNFLKLQDLIVMPSYNDKKYDDAAQDRLKELYQREVITIDASKLAREGGMINCVTWTDLTNS